MTDTFTPKTAAQDSVAHMKRIIVGLFNPMPDGHEKGCLFNDPHIHPRGPCICKYSEVAGAYLWSLREAKKIAAEHFGKEEVEKSRRLSEPQELVEAAALRRSDVQSALEEAVRLYENYDLTAGTTAAGGWINRARAALGDSQPPICKFCDRPTLTACQSYDQATTACTFSSAESK